VPVFLDTRGRSTLGIGICGRCSRKMSLDELQPDPNYPGLRVCKEDLDQYDPYRLPARQPEVIALQYPRPDTPLDGGVGLAAEIITSGALWDVAVWDESIWS
jgi:hypothetical protein